ncbi:hypothetical protein KC343_g2861 [Hortaea werneckii]|uniref:Uncharacterized protein n=1 Tax=Hortaea werneckii TaxID=91943 RepID=A0A3M7FWI3_HORWE|nr:hypothetical protein KC352_g9625 [Hortaea werneckii]KAI7572695.1 hypothetical protein KC317_g529 [Hortaea werneckii]KAI7623064.1 hypothetical protein KC346_g2907 [Hortaea werneckii]KAI7633586.1 hypothetical protein KC343_g2861 [Hortaea werneckii]KAI7679323.1 hypothetical protein KC319_g2828 [Hortaea werneckii]
MEPVSLSLTVLPLLFESAVNAFRFFQLGKAYGTHVQSACITLDVARCKLSDWGEAVGLGPAPYGSVDLQKTAYPQAKLQLAETLLKHIVVLFEEAELKSAKMQASQSPSDGATDLEATLPPGPPAHRGRMNEWWHRRQQPADLLMNKAKWALYRKEDFEALVANVNQKVDFLVELFPMTRQAQHVSHGDAHFALLEYNQWLGSRDEQLLLITGYTGCGKSVLTSAICRSLDEDPQNDTLLCCYFCGTNNEHRPDISQILKGLIYQLLDERRKLSESTRKSIDSLFSEPDPSFGELWAVFERLASHPQIGSIYLIVDAIDECKQNDVKRFLESLFVLMRAMKGRLKALLACQPGASAVHFVEGDIPDAGRLRMEQMNQTIAKDIDKLISQHVDQMMSRNQCDQNVGQDLKTALRARADGSFLWVTVILSLLTRHRAKRIKKCDVDAALAKGNLPDVFSNLYERCIHAIPEEEWEDARKMLLMLLANARPLSIPELGVLINMSSTNPHVSDILDADETTEVPHFEAMLGPLVKTSDDVVMLAHQTLASFLQAQQLASMSNATRFFASSEQSIHFEMAHNCMRYLMLEDRVPASPSESSLSSDIEDSSPQEHVAPQISPEPGTCDPEDFNLSTFFKENEDPIANELLALADRQKLFKYAARYWTFHFSRCREAEQEQLLDLAMRLSRPGLCSQWFAYLTMASQDATKFPNFPDSLMLASYFDLSVVVKRLLIDSPNDFNLGLAIFWAACRGSRSCLEILFAGGSIDAASAHYNGVSPLAIAACNGHQDSLEILLESRLFDVNEQNRQGRTPLSLAAGAGHDQVVARLLKEDGIDLNLADNQQASPAMWAAASAESSTMTLLLQHPHIDLSMQDSVGQNTLSWACSAGRAQTTRSLLKDGRCDPNLQDKKGKAPLMLAVSSESLPTVQAMTRHRDVKLALQDQNGRNAISWAAQSPDPRILDYLLLHGGAPFADAKDHDGWGALAWTLDPPPKPENARLLLKYASSEVNVPDTNGRPILSTAIEWGSTEIAQLLISSGVIDVDQPDRHGRGALSYAVRRGYTPLIVQLLTQDPSRADVPDSAGVTPHALALANGSSELREAFATASGAGQPGL